MPARAQDRASISGFVRDATTGETLLLANVVLEGTSLGTATNNAGYYTLTNLAAGDYTVRATFIGFQDVRVEVTLSAGQDRRLDIELSPDDVALEGVVVTAEAELEEENRNLGVQAVSTETIRQLPTILEPDVFRSLQLLPGIKAASDFSSGLYIRGGSPDQTLIMLDRTTVYNPSHLFGFFSPFNPDAIKDVRLYKGGYPAEYGGRLGSVVDIYNKDGNRNAYRGRLSVGLLASRGLIEGPYKYGSWMLAVRRSTIDPLLAALRNADIDNIPDQYFFYDINGKVNFDAGDNDRFSVSIYAGADNLEATFFEDLDIDLVYGNQTLSGNWTHIFSPRLFSNFTFTSALYRSDPVFNLANTDFSRINRIYDNSVKGDFEFIPNERHSLKVGFWSGNFIMRLNDTFDGNPSLNTRIETFYSALYVDETFSPTGEWQLRTGLRANYFAEGDYLRLEPRLGLEYRPESLGNVRLQVGYGRYYQFLTLITSELFSAFDVWLTTDNGVAPAFGDQFVAGAKIGLQDGINLDIEGYYRTMEDLFVLDPFLPDAAGFDYQDLFMRGEGFAYGGEVFLEKTDGRLNGFVGYSFAVTRRRFPLLNDFNYFSPKYDRTHDVSIVTNYDLSSRWRTTVAWVYGTGQAFTRPNGQYKLLDDPFGNASRDVLVADFNAQRLDPYHRLDFGFTNIGRFFGFADYEFQIQAINAYSRKNPWFVFTDFNDDGTTETSQVNQIPVIIPNLSFSLKF
ncbi:MAG: carboxypeptidase-like regulatory domain-containing protein [Bacteroidota bacterium]